MKTAISIPDDVFESAERLARRTKRSRSRLFSDALKEYLARHTPDKVTEAMNIACAELATRQTLLFRQLLAGLVSEASGNLSRRDLVGRPARSRRLRPGLSKARGAQSNVTL
jgi:hypothetical protein